MIILARLTPWSLVVSVLLLLAIVGGRLAHPKVELDYGSFIGKVQHWEGLERFYGIPFAEPPVGELRFANPIKPRSKYYDRDCTNYAPACPQQTYGGNTSTEPYKGWLNGQTLNPLAHLRALGPGQEDCLTLDITRPIGATNSSNLPVMFFIFPGGFNSGGSRQLSPKSIVKKSVALGMPVIHVAANHRVNAFGFLGGREVGRAGVGNLGLKDQRLALEWTQSYISQFGGDPGKVTIYGESSGAISVSHQLLAYHGQHHNLFRAAICQSGTALPALKLSEGAGQETFDYIVQYVGCADSNDKLACLREAPFQKLFDSLKHFPGTFSFGAFPLTFAPTIDGEFVTESVQDSLESGKFAKVPLISGDMLDEGTVLALATLPLRSEEDLRKFISTRLARPTQELITKILELWPSNPRLGSPYNAAEKYALTPVYKQYSSILGDFGFQAPRRLFLRRVSSSIPTWSYLDQAAKDVPILGAFHGSDLPALFGLLPGARKEEYQTRWISFANNLDPNHPGLTRWPNYYDPPRSGGDGIDSRLGKLLVFESSGATGTIPDDYRSQAIDFYLDHLSELTFISR